MPYVVKDLTFLGIHVEVLVGSIKREANMDLGWEAGRYGYWYEDKLGIEI